MKTKLILLALLLIIPGCGKKENSQETPADTLRTFTKALSETDKAGYMAVISGDATEKEAVGQMLGFVCSMDQFNKEIVAEYGAAEADKFQKGGPMTDMSILDLNKDIDKMKVEIKGEKATCTLPNSKKPMAMVKKDGLWYIDSKALEVGGGAAQADTKKFGEMWKILSSDVEVLRKKVGQEGVTVEVLTKELGDKMLSALMKSLAPEMKQNIDKMMLEKMKEQNVKPGAMPKLNIKAPPGQ